MPDSLRQNTGRAAGHITPKRGTVRQSASRGNSAAISENCAPDTPNHSPAPQSGTFPRQHCPTALRHARDGKGGTARFRSARFGSGCPEYFGQARTHRTQTGDSRFPTGSVRGTCPVRASGTADGFHTRGSRLFASPRRDWQPDGFCRFCRIYKEYAEPVTPVRAVQGKRGEFAHRRRRRAVRDARWTGSLVRSRRRRALRAPGYPLKGTGAGC